MRRVPATGKLNLALVVGPARPDGKHELATVLQRIDLADRIELAEAPLLRVDGFADDTLVSGALEALAAAAGVEPRWRARIHKRIPVAGGLGGGSSDAAAALKLANETLAEPLAPVRLHELARALGADVPFFLADGPQLGEGDGADLTPLDLPQDYFVLLLLPDGAAKQSTGAVYAAFDERDGAAGWPERRTALAEALARVRRPRDLAALPPNDLASSPLADELRRLGAFRADVSGAGPTVYGLFHHRRAAEAAKRVLEPRGRLWITVPAWYG
jgi:4-diphosphocytidyl-2-C-methyl-D-erythritol kinase